ncbi:conserved hypothetical protein [Desulfamplus magnetovallimortis]|uniref:Uncharacterized protein n=1 Tax=Desulfamplus magnetovallimortis TaxID=1246637 RepID=A0A1W1H5K1_9BACT|nr:hypothetical protein [Desulfamplus magnetovallimortis]SLM27726.1 conserved hypothetical protein [Desulfamplus magnetovallimortis]
MLRKDLIQKSPAVQIMGKEYLEQGKFGAVVSRAGVGKTQFLVQIAISWLLDGKKVIHISLDDAIDKINVRYKEGYNSLIDSVGYIDPIKANRLWEDLDICKFGINYNRQTFASKNIRDYLATLKKDNLEIPAMIVVDGIDFDGDCSDILDDLAKLAADFSLAIWFSMQSHREENLTSEGFPVQLDNVKARFSKALFLKPREDKIEVVILKNGAKVNEKHLIEPATMMLI